MSVCTEKLHKTLERDLGRVKNFTEQSTPSHVACYLLQQNLVKKYTDGASSIQAEKAGIEKFELVNKQVNEWEPPVRCVDEQVFKALRLAQQLHLSQYLDKDGFAKFGLSHAFNRGSVGSGASVGAVSSDVFGKLFKSKLTCTNKILYTLFKSATYNNFRWEIANLVRASQFGKFKVVQGSNLFTVPKETVIARVAFTEPTLNMWGQLGMGECIHDLLKQYHDIDLSVQPKYNGWFARSGSLTGEDCTIDLVSASDTIGLRFGKWHLPARLMKDLETLRSKSARLPNRGGSMTLNMISTMGNGFTFPLQTWIFANLVLAAYLELEIPTHDIYGKRTYGVFGDDIVCKKAAYPLVTKMLAACGFTVNDKKSFSTGSFRESCGKDYFRGHNVRAVYFKEYNDPAHVYSLINRLMVWSATHKVALTHTCSYLLGLVDFRPVPMSEDIMSGIRTPIEFLTSRKTDAHGNWIYHPVVPTVIKNAVEESNGDLFWHGAVLANIHGTIRSGCVVPRTVDNTVYKVIKRSCVTSWNYVVSKSVFERSLYDHDAGLTIQEFSRYFNKNIIKKVDIVAN